MSLTSKDLTVFSCKLTENYDNGDLVGSLSFPELVVQETDALLDLTNLRHQPDHVDYHHPPILFLPMVRPIPARLNLWS